MKTENHSMLARVKSLALAAMIQQGGKPCWVAAYAPTGSPAARPIPSPQAAKMHLAPQYRPRRSPPPPPSAQRRSPPSAGGAAPAAGSAPALLNTAERRKLSALGSAAVDALERLINHLRDDQPETSTGKRSVPAPPKRTR